MHEVAIHLWLSYQHFDSKQFLWMSGYYVDDKKTAKCTCKI